jgi:hypothetical protein
VVWIAFIIFADVDLDPAKNLSVDPHTDSGVHAHSERTTVIKVEGKILNDWYFAKFCEVVHIEIILYSSHENFRC